MSEENTQVQDESGNEAAAPDERTVLLGRARMMGLKVSNNIGLETLKARIAAVQEGEAKAAELSEQEPAETPAAPAPVAPAAAPAVAAVPAQMAENAKPLTQQELRAQVIKDAMKLVRLRVTCLDPKKKDLPGEIFTVANDWIGTVKKFVPFGEFTDNGYHVPYCIYEFMKSRQFLSIRTRKTKNDGVVVDTNYVPEFALEVLPQLTEKELKELAIQQAAAAGQAS